MAKAPCLSSEAESARGTIDSCADHKPLTMHEPARFSGGRRGDHEASMRDETVFRVANSRYHANPRCSRGGAADFPARTGIPIAKTAKRLA